LPQRRKRGEGGQRKGCVFFDFVVVEHVLDVHVSSQCHDVLVTSETFQRFGGARRSLGAVMSIPDVF
jgi:hypothetical protein